jgi:hypothetical protein
MLPKIDVPIYETKMISTGNTIKFRPFLVKEQKLFLMASQSDDTKDMISAIKQVINNCVLDEIDVDSLATFDLEYLFLQLRARSVNEVVNLKYNCNNKITKDDSILTVYSYKVSTLQNYKFRYEANLETYRTREKELDKMDKYHAWQKIILIFLVIFQFSQL